MIDDYVKKWLIKAVKDLKVAENEIKVSPDDLVTEAICFHAQQAVEKFLKAYLINKNVEFKKTHNLEFLLDLCAKIDRDFENIDVGDLSFYAVEIRYPDEFYVPTFDEAKECLKITRNVKEFVLNKLGVKENELHD
ncbi:HEPN domain-containing protein [Candidatus Pyrohabitans sp.]